MCPVAARACPHAQALDLSTEGLWLSSRGISVLGIATAKVRMSTALEGLKLPGLRPPQVCSGLLMFSTGSKYSQCLWFSRPPKLLLPWLPSEQMVAPVFLFSTIIRYLLVGICAARHWVQFARAGVMKPSGKLLQVMNDHTSLCMMITFVAQLLASKQWGGNGLALPLPPAHSLLVILFLPKACHCLQDSPALPCVVSASQEVADVPPQSAFN